MLVGEDHQVLGLLQCRVERLAQALVELVRLLALLRTGLRQALDREDVELDLLGVVHRARIAAEAKFSDVMTTGLTSIPPSRLLGCPGVKLPRVFSRIVRPGVITAKLRVPSAAKYSMAAGHDVRLANPRRGSQ